MRPPLLWEMRTLWRPPFTRNRRRKIRNFAFRIGNLPFTNSISLAFVGRGRSPLRSILSRIPFGVRFALFTWTCWSPLCRLVPREVGALCAPTKSPTIVRVRRMVPKRTLISSRWTRGCPLLVRMRIVFSVIKRGTRRPRSPVTRWKRTPWRIRREPVNRFGLAVRVVGALSLGRFWKREWIGLVCVTRIRSLNGRRSPNGRSWKTRIVPALFGRSF